MEEKQNNGEISIMGPFTIHVPFPECYYKAIKEETSEGRSI
jgi:hypothetical protein